VSRRTAAARHRADRLAALLLPALICSSLLAAVGSTAVGADQGPEVHADLGPAEVGMDELATLSIEVSSQGFGLLSFEPHFRLDKLEIADGPSTSQSQRWVNGATSASTRLTWRLRPLALGRGAVRDLRVTIAGRELRLPDQEIEIVRQAPPGRAAPPAPAPFDPFGAVFGDQDPFAPFRRPQRAASAPKIRLSDLVDRPSVWVGEQIDWSLLLDTQTDISAFNPDQLPDFKGFWVVEIPVPQQPKPQWIEVDGEKYGRVVMLRRALFPLRPGRFRLEPTSADVVARVADAGWFGPLGHNEQISLSTQPLEVEARPLPPGPDGFSGVVGAVDLRAGVDRPRIDLGEAATLTVTASGSGHLQGLAPPTLRFPAGLRAFAPRPETSTRIAHGRLETTATWRYVLIADRPGSYVVPPTTLTWFDPETASYRSSSSAPVTIEAVAPAAVSQVASKGPASPAPSSSDAFRGRRLVATATALAGLVAAAGLAVVLRRRVAFRKSSSRTAQRRLVEEALAAARAEPSPRRAATVLEAAWRDFGAARWSLPPGLAVVHWPERLEPAGVPRTLAAGLVQLFDELHYLRYAPELSNVETLREEALEHSARLLRDLR
jgi:hypothetical protein